MSLIDDSGICSGMNFNYHQCQATQLPSRLNAKRRPRRRRRQVGGVGPEAPLPRQTARWETGHHRKTMGKA